MSAPDPSKIQKFREHLHQEWTGQKVGPFCPRLQTRRDLPVLERGDIRSASAGLARPRSRQRRGRPGPFDRSQDRAIGTRNGYGPRPWDDLACRRTRAQKESHQH